MATRKSPNIFHPTKHGAVGSRNSFAQNGREQNVELKRFVNETVDKVMNSVINKLPEPALKQLDVMGGIKEKLYNYINTSYQNMFNRYLTTVEDEMAKKLRDFIDREETKASNKYNPRELAELLDQIAGPDKFNTGEIEKSVINMYGHLQGHVQRGVNDLENETNNILRQKTDVGAFVRGQNFYSVVKCAFKDNTLKPKTVMNVKLSINIHDNELISPIFHHQVTVEYIVKDMISKHILDKLTKEIEKINEELIEAGEEELSHDEEIIKKMQKIDGYTSDDREDPNSNRYKFLAKHLMERIEGLRAEINPKDYDALNIRENIKAIFDEANIRNRGFNTAINNLTSILDTSKMGYQYCENMKNCREFIIREYEDIDETQLPDERYTIEIKYYDQGQINALRKAYEKQVFEFQKEARLIENITEYILLKRKKPFKLNDFADLTKHTFSWRKKNLPDGELLYEDQTKLWDEHKDVVPEETEVEKQNRTYIIEKADIKRLLLDCQKKLIDSFGHQHPKARIILDQRIIFLLKKFEDFDYKINPNHIQKGLILETDIVTTKRKRFIMKGMANVLNEFLAATSKGFIDQAFATFSRRRSTIRDDLDQDFVSESVGSEDIPEHSFNIDSPVSDEAPSDAGATSTEAEPESIDTGAATCLTTAYSAQKRVITSRYVISGWLCLSFTILTTGKIYPILYVYCFRSRK
jgi:hypothetical protein